MAYKFWGSLTFVVVAMVACVQERSRNNNDDDDGNGPSGSCGCEMTFNGDLVDIPCNEVACLGSQSFACVDDGEVQPAGPCQATGAGGSTSSGPSSTNVTTGGGECAPVGESCASDSCCEHPDTVIACDANFGSPWCCVPPGFECIDSDGFMLPCCGPGGTPHGCTSGTGTCEPL